MWFNLIESPSVAVLFTLSGIELPTATANLLRNTRTLPIHISSFPRTGGRFTVEKLYNEVDIGGGRFLVPIHHMLIW